MATQIEIKRGDTLSGLAQQHGTTVADFQQANPNITDPNLIRAGESLNLPGQTQSFSDNVIDAERVASEQPLSIPQVQEPAGERAIEEVLSEGRRTTQQIAEQRAQEATRETDTSRTQLQERVSDILGLQQERISAEEEAGVPQMTQQLAEMASQIEAKEHQMRRMIEEIQDTPGISQAQANRRIAEVQRQSARELADLSIVHNAKLRNLEATQAAIDRRINLELEGLQFQLQFDQMFYQENRQRMTQAEDQRFQLMLQQEEREYQAQLREKEQIGNVALTAAQYGANANQIEQIFGARNFEEAMKVGGEFLGVPFLQEVRQMEFQMELQSAQLEIEQRRFQSQEQERAFNQAVTLAGMGHQGSIKKLGLTMPDNTTATSTDLSFAREYAETGKMPSNVPDARRNLIEDLALQMPKPPGRVVSSITGVTPSNVTPSQVQDYGTSYNLIEQVGELSRLASEIPQSAFVRTLSRVTPSGREQIREYQNKRNEILRELRRRDYGARPSEWTIEEIEARLPSVGGMEREGFFSFVPTVGEFGLITNKKAMEKLDETTSFMSSTLNNQMSAQGLSMYGFTIVENSQGRFTVGDMVESQDGRRFIVNADGSYTEVIQ